MTGTDKVQDQIKKIVEDITQFIASHELDQDPWSVIVAETCSSEEKGLKELKLSWVNPVTPHSDLSAFVELKGKLGFLAKDLNSRELDDFLNELEDFQLCFLQFREPWVVGSWRFYYLEEHSQIALYDTRKAFLVRRELENRENPLSVLEKLVNSAFWKQVNGNLETIKETLLAKAKALPGIIQFQKLIDQLQIQVEQTLSAGLKAQWDELVGKEQTTPADTVLGAFIVRISVELALKKKFSHLLPKRNKLTLGEVFNNLWKMGYFINERKEIPKRLNILNKVVHGKQPTTTMSEITAIKEWFRVMLSKNKITLTL